MESESSVVERPLSGAAKLGLVGGAGATILLAYCFSLASILLLLLVVAFEMVLVLALIRFGLAGVMARCMERHVNLLVIFFRSCWLRKGVELRIPLPREEAPALFSILDRLCLQLEVAVPREVALEMSANAWVRLRGFRRGAGTTKLGLGFDLLAGLTAAEIEAVLAHEMVHAQSIQRGYRRWLTGGLSRIVALATALANHAGSLRQARRSTEDVDLLLRSADAITRRAARLVATYSRQDEFAADRGAAELCGAGVFRSALSKIDLLGGLTARLPWRERMAQLQSGNGFSQWLVQELGRSRGAPSPESGEGVFNAYSTHPLLRDRLAALPTDMGSAPAETRPAIGLLVQPDAVAERLISEIQRAMANEERKDTRRLRRWTRKVRGASHLRPLQLLAVLMVLLGILFGLGALVVGTAWFQVALPGMVFIVVGIVLFRLGRYRDRLELPVPAFALLAAEREGCPDVQAAQHEIEAALRTLMGAQKKRRHKSHILVGELFGALGRCEYLRAHVAARLCLELNKKSVEGNLGLAIASAGLGAGQQAAGALASLRQATGLSGRSTSWGAAWALLLLGDWATAEALLDQALKARPDETTFLALLAICQSRRGKLQLAISSARRACELEPTNQDYAKLLVGLLLDGGYAQEAQRRLVPLEPLAQAEPELMLAMVQLNLLHHNLEKAEQWTQRLKTSPAGPHLLIRLGLAHEAARRGQEAAGLYRVALGAGHYPEAHLGLARLELQRSDKEQAKLHVFSALDLQRPLAKDAVGPLPLLPQSLSQLVALREPVPKCRAWIATLGPNAPIPALANRSFMVYAVEQAEAERQFNAILAAMQPNRPPLIPGAIRWKEAPRPQQPIGPARPGVQGLLG